MGIVQVGFWENKPIELRMARGETKRLHKAVAQSLFERGLKYCPQCQCVLSLDKFQKAKTPRGVRPYCTECWRRVERKRSRKARPAQRKIRLDSINRWRRAFGGECARCGKVEWLELLDFHHIDPNEKEIGISNLALRLSVNCSDATDERIVDELDKCAALCLNCHGAYHRGLWDGEWIKRDGLGWTLAK